MGHTNDRFLYSLKYMNTTMKADNKAGHQWKYCNVTSKKAKSFPAARKQGKYLINCVDGVQWACRLAGVPGSALAWYCANGKIVWCSTNAQANCKKYFQIIRVGNKTVRQLQSAGMLLPGDVLGYQNLAHTNAYYAKNKSFDSGHTYCTGSGEGAKFKKWIGSLSCGSSTVSYILRLKDRTRYRVQCGAFTDLTVLASVESKLKKAGFNTIRFVEDGMTKLQAGLFDSKDNAEKLRKRIAAKGFSVIIKEV